MTTNETPQHPWHNPDVLQVLARWMGLQTGPHFSELVSANTWCQGEVRSVLLVIFIANILASATSSINILTIIILSVMGTYFDRETPKDKISTPKLFILLLAMIGSATLGAITGSLFRDGAVLQFHQYLTVFPLLLFLIAVGFPGRKPGNHPVGRGIYYLHVRVNAAWMWAQFLITLFWTRCIRVKNEWDAWRSGNGSDPDDWNVEYDCPRCPSDSDGGPGRLQMWPTLKHPQQVLCDRCGADYKVTEPVSPDAIRAANLRRLEKRRRTHPNVLLVMLDPRREGELGRAFRIESRFDPATGSWSPGGVLPAPDGPAVLATMKFHNSRDGAIWAGDADAVVAVVPAAAPANVEADRWNDVEIALASVECPFDATPLRSPRILDRWTWFARALRRIVTPARQKAADWWFGTPPVLTVWMPGAGASDAPPGRHRGQPVVCLRTPADLHRALSDSMDALRADVAPNAPEAMEPCLTD